MEELKELLEPLFKEQNLSFSPATEEQLEGFHIYASQQQVPENAIQQLLEFYQLTNGVKDLDGIDFHAIQNDLIFEFWAADNYLWIGQRGFDCIRWRNGFFMLGSSAEFNYGEEYITENLTDIIYLALQEWYPEF